MAGLHLRDASSACDTTVGTWTSWNYDYIVCTSSTTLTATTWAAWCYDCTASATSTSDIVWYSWQGSESTPVRLVSSVPQLTPEQVAENQRIAREREEKRVAIRERAKEILVAHLDRKQREAFQRHKYFEVISQRSKRRYLVAEGTVYELNAKGDRLRSFCIHPQVAYPEYDNMLAKKILLEADEREFLRIANATQLRVA